MKKVKNHSTNCVGVITVRWSVTNEDVKSIYGEIFGFCSKFPTETEQKKMKENVQKKVQEVVENNKANFKIDKNSVVRFSSSIKLIGCEFLLINDK